MRIFVIGDRETVLGFRLVGVKGRAVEEKGRAAEALEEALQRRDAALLLVTREIAALLRDRIDRLKMERLQPLVLEIPGPQDSGPEEPVGELVHRAIGIRL